MTAQKQEIRKSPVKSQGSGAFWYCSTWSDPTTVPPKKVKKAQQLTFRVKSKVFSRNEKNSHFLLFVPPAANLSSLSDRTLVILLAVCLPPASVLPQPEGLWGLACCLQGGRCHRSCCLRSRGPWPPTSQARPQVLILLPHLLTADSNLPCRLHSPTGNPPHV